MKKEQSSAAQLGKKKEASQKKVDTLKEAVEKLAFDENEFNALEEEKDQLEPSVAELSDLVENLQTQLESRLKFEYSDPVRGFDRSKVKGIVANLIQVKQKEHATAIEVAAGGKLYQVVVDEAITGKALLDRGSLKKRVTIIPLDKIQSRRIPDSACDAASKIAQKMNATANPAIELVGFDKEVQVAMEHVLGSVIVADDTKAANKICEATKCRTVTLDGDSYDPSGTISGGSKGNLGTTLSNLTELAVASEQLKEQKERLAVVASKLKSLKAKAADYEKFSGKLEIAEAELAGIAKHLSQTSYGVLVEKFESMTTELDEAQKVCQAMEKEKDEKWALHEELKEREIELTQEREQRLAGIENAVKQAKKNATAKAKSAREAESKSQTLLMELESLKADVVVAEQAVEAAQKAVDEAKEEEDEKQMKVGEIKAFYDEAKAQLDEIEESMMSCNADLAKLKNARAELSKKAEAAALEAKKLSVAIARIQKERSNAEKAVAHLLKKHAWIESEKSAFGVKDGDYDFEATNPAEMSRTLNALKSEQESLSKKINKKVMGMIEKAEGEYTELLRKRKVVENDKKKIQSVIEELDVKKKTELQRTWVKVNRDFGSIFSTLLPGARAKLEPPEGMEAWEGLEVKVAFGDVWKESLSELSGGQRSLLALSLILSLLLFKPAPMYILDEVDAALDLSHTQNIGNMLKTHFSQSQFIVVSLKEGMFNNANVIFRTKFVDGVSTVTRTIGTGASSKARELTESQENVGNSQPKSRNNKTSRATTGRRGKENAIA